MGAGKSSVGRALANRTGLPLFDIDELVTARLGVSIAEIFARDGEEGFREAETAELAQLPRAAAVIVTGGGIVLRSQNVAALQRLGIVVHLTADEATLYERAMRRPTRPLLQAENPRERFTHLLRVRAPLYDAAANASVVTSALRHEEVVDAVLEELARVRRRAN